MKRKITIGLVLLLLLVLAITVLAQGEWWERCPPDPPAPSPWPPQPTYTALPTYTAQATYTALPTPTCRPTHTPVVEPSPTPYPAQTPYPTHTPLPTQTPYPPQPSEAGADGERTRMLWAWDYSWNITAARLDEMLDRAERGGFDTVLFYVGCGAVNYESDLLPKFTYVGEFDALAYIVERAHARGLKVQAWWAVGEVMKDSAFRARYPVEWDAANLPGIPDDEHYLDFSLPEVRAFVADAVVEMAMNYNVNGVHLDYIRYEPPPPWGAYDPANFFDPDDVPKTVELCHRRLKEVGPDILLTAAVMSSRGSSEGHLQNWEDWLAGGYIDRVMPMAYYEVGDATLDRDVAYWRTLPHPERIAPGLKADVGGVMKTPEQFIEQVELCRAMGFGDFAMYSEYGVPAEFLDALGAYR